MRKLALLACLAGCTQAGPETPPRFCAAQANNDPEVRALIIQGVSSPTGQEKTQEALRGARQRAVLACLKRQGVAPPPGGVEPPVRTDTIFQ